MARSREELLKYYPDQIASGGHDPLELADRLKVDRNLSFTNMPVFIMAVSVEAQFALLERLDEMGFLQ